MKKKLFRHHSDAPRKNLLQKLCCCILALSLWTGVAKAQNDNNIHSKTIAIGFNKESLNTALLAIEKQSGYRLVYPSELVEKAPMVNLPKEERTIAATLQLILAGTNLGFKQTGNTIVIFQLDKEEPASAKTRAAEVTGRITDSSGEGLAGAFVQVKNNNSKNTITNASGNFTLKDVDLNSMLVISYMGFETMEVALNGRAQIEIHLVSSASPLDEVQVIAYGTTTKRYNAGNISTVKAADIAKQTAVSNPVLALQGRVPGLFIIQTTGLPGANLEIQLQGQNSIDLGNDPFFVVDGVPYMSTTPKGLTNLLGDSSSGAGNPFSFISPSDIESIEVLKDADATAIYGSRAANGAILITTKKGQEGRTKVDIELQNGWGKILRRVKMLNTGQYLEIRREGMKNDNAPILVGDYDLNGTWDQNRYTDWQELWFGGTAHNSMVRASVSGGNVQTQFMIGATFRRETSVFDFSGGDNKGSLFFNVGHTSANKKFRIQLTGTYTVDSNNLPYSASPGDAIELAPNAPDLRNPDGTINWAQNENGVSTWANPLAAFERKYLIKTNNLISNAVVSYSFTPELRIQTNLGYTNLQSNEMITYPLTAVRPENRATAERSANFMFNNVYSWVVEPQITYNKNIGSGKLEALVGFSMQRNISNTTSITGRGHSSDLLLEDITSAATVTSTGDQAIYKYVAVFGRVKYNLLERYIIDLTARRDGSSRFGPESQFNNFWAVGAGYIFSEESFIKNNLPFLSYGKIRGSYGTTGSDQLGNYKYLSVYGSVAASATIPYQGIQGLMPSGLPNPYLQWEETRKLQFGLDLGFLKDRILINVGYFRNRSDNQLLNSPLTITTGFSSISMNLAALVQNTGWELELRTINFRGKDFRWTTAFNLTLPKNKLIDFPGLAESSYANTYVVGQPTRIRKQIPFVGVNPQTGLYEFRKADGTISSTPNTTDDATIYRQQAPFFYGGFDNSFIYKNFELSVLFQFTKRDGWVRDELYGNQPGGSLKNMPVAVLKRWQKEGDIASIQRISKTYPSSISTPMSRLYSNSDACFGDVSYIRLKNVSLSYKLPQKWMEKIHIDNCKVYFQGQNMYTFTKYIGLDPEWAGYGWQSPPIATFTVGLNIGL